MKADKRRHLVKKVLFIVVLVCILFSALVYLLFFAGLLDVRAVNIEVDEHASEIKDPIAVEVNQWLDGRRSVLQRRRNLLLINAVALQVLLKKNYSKADAVQISKRLPHTLEIHVTGRTPSGIWCTSAVSACYYFNREGIIYESAPQTSGFLVLKVIDERTREVEPGDKVLESEWMKAIGDVYGKLKQKNFNIKTLVIPKDSLSDFYVLTSTNLKILLDIHTDILAQIDSLTGFIAQKISPEKLAKLEYIDLRIQDRIYYK